jgi:hypothetical protein
MCGEEWSETACAFKRDGPLVPFAIAEHEDDGMMAIIRVTSSSAAATLEKFRIGLASLGWFRTDDVQAAPACCVNGRYRTRRLRPQLRNRSRQDARSFEPASSEVRTKSPTIGVPE